MKKFTLFTVGVFAFLLFVSTSSHAQMFSNSFQIITGGNSGVNTNTPTNTLDVNGTARVRTIGQNESLTRILAADANGVINWRDVDGIDDMDWLENGAGDAIFNNPIYNRVGVNNPNPSTQASLHVGNSSNNGIIRFGSVESIRDNGPNLIETGQGDLAPDFDCTRDLGRSGGNRWDRLFVCRGVFQMAVPTPGTGENKRVAPLQYGLQEVMSMTPKMFECETCPKKGTQIGLAADQLQALVPQAVMDPATDLKLDEEGNPMKLEGDKMVNYSTLVPVLIKAIQEQQERIEQDAQTTAQLMEQIAQLQEAVSALQEGKQSKKSIFENSNQESDQGMLFQNEPNPFGESSNIRFYIPEGTTNASLELYGIDGKQIKRIPIQGTGMGQITINASELPSGVLSYYTLIINDQQVDTRKMLVISHN